MSYYLEQRPRTAETIHKIAAAYSNPTDADTVVDDLRRAGLAETDITVMHPWPVTLPPEHSGNRLLDQPVWMGLISGLVMGVVVSIGALLWANPDHWMVYGALGMVLGVVSGSLAGALSATSPPHWHDQKLGDPLGATTVEVSTTDRSSYEIATRVMSLHHPTLIEARREKGARPPMTTVLWEHPAGLSPLQVLGAWRRGELPPTPPRPRRLPPERVMWVHPESVSPLQVLGAWVASGSLRERLGTLRAKAILLRRPRGRHMAERQGWASVRPWRLQDGKILGSPALSQTGDRRLPPRDLGRHSTRPRPGPNFDLPKAFDLDPVGVSIVLVHDPERPNDETIEIELDHLTGIRR